MHEISLVQGLIQQLHQLAEQHGAERVCEVSMEIGPLSGVVVESFRFGFEILATEDPLLHRAHLAIVVPTVRFTCSNCGQVTESASGKPERCIACGDRLLLAAGGEEVVLLQVQME